MSHDSTDTFRPWLLRPGSMPAFPDPHRAPADEGLVAVGGDLGVSRLLLAYASGIFPWYNEGMPILWWSPEPRTILRASELHVSRSLARTLKQHHFELALDRDFEGVLDACSDREEGTWLVPEMKQAYLELFRRGFAHSIEVYQEGNLTGGLYGVHIGGFFAGESMFHRRTDASKIALVTAVRSLARAQITLFDVQFMTSHLGSLGARSISRDEYLRELSTVLEHRVSFHDVTLAVTP